MMTKFGEPWSFGMQIWPHGVKGDPEAVVAEFDETIGGGFWGILERISEVEITETPQVDGTMYYIAKADVINHREVLKFKERKMIFGKEYLIFSMEDVNGKVYGSGYQIPVSQYFVKKREPLDLSGPPF